MEQLHLLLVHLITSSTSDFQIPDTAYRILTEMSHSVFHDGAAFIIESYQNNIVNTQNRHLAYQETGTRKHKTRSKLKKT